MEVGLEAHGLGEGLVDALAIEDHDLGLVTLDLGLHDGGAILDLGFLEVGGRPGRPGDDVREADAVVREVLVLEGGEEVGG